MGALGISKLQFLRKKNKKNFTCKYLQFLVIKTLDPDPHWNKCGSIIMVYSTVPVPTVLVPLIDINYLCYRIFLKEDSLLDLNPEFVKIRILLSKRIFHTKIVHVLLQGNLLYTIWWIPYWLNLRALFKPGRIVYRLGAGPIQSQWQDLDRSISKRRIRNRIQIHPPWTDSAKDEEKFLIK